MKLFLFILLLPIISADLFLENWIGQLSPIYENRTIFDLRLPATHDSLSYDLGYTISDGAWDNHPYISDILHILSYTNITPNSWIRDNAMTQSLNITEQLNNGIRFIDFRIMYTANDWYSLHFLQSKRKALEYMKIISDWLRSHKDEIIIIECTRHGQECAPEYEEYPNVPLINKQEFWNATKDIFDNLIIDTKPNLLNKTPLKELIVNNKRVLFLMADYSNFTNNDSKAYDLCKHVESNGNGGTWPYQNKIDRAKDIFSVSHHLNKKYSSNNKFFTYYINFLEPSYDTLLYSLEIRYLPEKNTKKSLEKCSKLFEIPGMNMWCPKYLLDGSQQSNFYHQIVLDYGYKKGWDMPFVLAVDALDKGGGIRVGSQLISNKTISNNKFSNATYPYNDIIIYNIISKWCSNNYNLHCSYLHTLIENRLQNKGIQLWNEVETGRLKDWLKI